MYIYLKRFKNALGNGYDFALARCISFPINIFIVLLLSNIDRGSNDILLYGVFLIGSLINGTAGQALYRCEIATIWSAIHYVVAIFACEILLIVILADVRNYSLLNAVNIKILCVITIYVSMRVFCVVMSSYLYNSTKYFQALNLIISKVLDLLLVYSISNSLVITVSRIDGEIVTLAIVLVLLMLFFYKNNPSFVGESLIRFPVSAMYFIFSYSFFNILSESLLAGAAFLLRMKGMFDAIASVLSVITLKKNNRLETLFPNKLLLILALLASGVSIHVDVYLGMAMFSLVAIYTSKIYSGLINKYGVVIYSIAWCIPLLISTLMLEFYPSVAVLSYAIAEIFPLVIIYLFERRCK
jgi:hypothetical protein